MSEKTQMDPAGLFSLSRDWLAAQQKFMPSGRLFSQLAETIRIITQAQITYAQTVMRAEAALLAAMMEVPGESAGAVSGTSPEPGKAAKPEPPRAGGAS